MSVNDRQRQTLERLARRYVWWQTPTMALRNQHRVIAQVMNLGSWDDVLRLLDVVGEARLRDALAEAVAGEFNARSWHFWHYRLGLTPIGGSVPPLPMRRLS
jgi:hypothetical protein